MQLTSLKTRGLTLIELSVAAGLALMLLVLTLQFVLPAFRLSARAQARVQLQESCYLAIQKMRMDLEQTNAAAVGFLAQGPGEPMTIVAMQPLKNDVNNDRPLYELKLVSYHWDPAVGSIVRRQWDPAPSIGASFDPSLPTRLAPAELRQLPPLSNANESRVVCQDVSNFTIQSPVTAPNVANPVRIKIVCTRQVVASQPDQCTLEQAVFLRNSP